MWAIANSALRISSAISSYDSSIQTSGTVIILSVRMRKIALTLVWVIFNPILNLITYPYLRALIIYPNLRVK